MKAAVAALVVSLVVAAVPTTAAQAYGCTDSVPSAGNTAYNSWGKPYSGTAVWGVPNYKADWGCPGDWRHGGHDWDKEDPAFNILSVAYGTVEDAYWDDCVGKYLVVRHGNSTGTRFSIYGHLSARLVDPGEQVIMGSHIGESGSDGDCTAADHLHYSMSLHWDETAPSPWDASTLYPSRQFLLDRGVAVS